MEILVFFLLGLVVGSFLNVCIYRIPRKISIVKPFSFCPSCGNTIKPYHNIPILSFILLKGRCAYCGAKISGKYPLVELLNGVLYALAYSSFGLSIHLFFIFIFLSSLVAISFIDMDFQIIPDSISLPLIVFGVIFSLLPESDFLRIGVKESIIGIFVGGGSLLLVAILSKGGMGGGDIKLNAAIGAFLGWKFALLTVFVGSVFGSLMGIIMMKKTGNRKIPFGPFLSIGAIISLFMGDQILRWYLG